MSIPVSAKGFAEFVLGGPAKKAQIVRNILKPRTAEAKVITLYYSRAIRIIRLYHAKHNDKNFLKEEIRSLEEKLAKATSPQSRAALSNNIRAVRAYMELYGNRVRKVVPRPRIYFNTARVRLSASPDLAIEEDKKLRLVKIGTTKKGDNPEVIRIMLRVIYQAAIQRFQIEPRDVIYFDVANAARVHGRNEDAHLQTTIESGCELLASMC